MIVLHLYHLLPFISVHSEFSLSLALFLSHLKIHWKCWIPISSLPLCYPWIHHLFPICHFRDINSYLAYKQQNENLRSQHILIILNLCKTRKAMTVHWNGQEDGLIRVYWAYWVCVLMTVHQCCLSCLPPCVGMTAPVISIPQCSSTILILPVYTIVQPCPALLSFLLCCIYINMYLHKT